MDKIPVQSDELSLKDLVGKIKEWKNYLFSKWKIIILIAFIGAALGLTYSIIKKPIYKATLSFALEDEKSGGLGGALGLASTFGLDVGGSGGGIFEGSNLTELFKSRSMVEKTLLSPVTFNGKNMSLVEMYLEINKLRDGWDKDPKYASIKFLPDADRTKFTRVQDSILGDIYGNLSKTGLSVGQKDKKISIISIDVSSTNELFAKFFCESLARQVGLFYVDTKSKKARMNMQILERQVDSVRRELNNAITGVAIANDNTFGLNPALNVKRTPSAKRQVDVQANTAILTELVKQTELAKVTLRKETPLIQVVDRPILPLAKERFGKAKGILLGGFAGGFLTIIYLMLKRLLNYFL
ncbi:Wzz/FepE/Etk N-terminal domain-containing protein [Flavobacterium sp. S87F.05.LMB.W.Kidney.N]|uniref:Wzz/FepE/Etk N-terminal domain-containing protein n=1 Tax=Flavobacterium sp. S87F.05.LMB.W.Kidney.N TaxID=1278758 RepID=UPI001065A51D|nr:Wzz/FepE/Etk N-terminal domain-containing protein [Flavobacterium sp. S87F.05.LMB.W.Kidney.N]TDX09267.1 subunit length determinant protein [Flavobacterium sp. S87F.05.LMB.W.Kidney.N]